MTSKKVAFIMASEHSGSTLLQLILASHSRAFGLGELVNLERGLDAPYEEYPRLCLVCEGRCPFWNDTADVRVLKRFFSRRGLIAPIFRQLSCHRQTVYKYLFGWSGADVLVDSSKGVRWIDRQLRRHRHSSEWSPALIYLTRDGRAVINSLLRKYPSRNLEAEIRKWQKKVLRMNEFYAGFPERQRFKLSYENLATNPDEVMRAVCRFLELDFEPEMLRFWEHEHHTTYGNSATRSLIARYRLTSGQGEATQAAAQVMERVRGRHGAHYDDLGLAIKLDERWRRDLSAEQLRVFEEIAGATNKSFAYDPASPSTER